MPPYVTGSTRSFEFAAVISAPFARVAETAWIPLVNGIDVSESVAVPFVVV